MQARPVISFIVLLLASCALWGQDKSNVKFGNVTEKDFATKLYPIDSNANSVVLADIGTSQIEGNTKGWFSINFKHFKRIHILNKNGYDVADVSIHIYTNGDDEVKLEKLKAVTYNLENGKVVETKLETRTAVYETRLDKNWKVRKFTFPNIKEGSIIEYEYTTVSDFINNLDPWEFQGSYPVLWSEFNLTVPNFFYYVFLSQGYRKFDISDRKDGRTSYNIIIPNGVSASDRIRVDANVTDYRWVAKNVPALNEENFTSTIKNHTQKIEFQLVEQRDPLQYHRYVESWPQVAGKLLEAEYFGEQLNKDNGWLKDIVKPLIDGVADPVEKTKRIYYYVRDNFTCTDRGERYMNKGLKNTMREKKGNVAEINLLLTAMLKYADIHADPVLLSTRGHGITYALYPILSQYNYVIAQAVVNNKPYYMDATEPGMGFGHLPLKCYNGHARVISKEAQEIDLNSDAVNETKFTTVFIINNEKGELIGSFQQTPGYYRSLDIREEIKEMGKEGFLKAIQKNFGTEVEVSNLTVDSLTKPDEVVSLKFDFDIKQEKADIIYLNPIFGEGYKENPFKSAERLYPVEMPYTIDRTYNLQLEVPAGYVVDELPKSILVKLNEQEEGYFEYRISQSGSNISFRTRVKINRTFFLPDEYEMLREFFNLVVKKYAEQIVFKKK